MTQVQKLELQKTQYTEELTALKDKINRLTRRAKQIKENLLPALDADIKGLTELKETVPRSELESAKVLKELQSTGSNLFQKSKEQDLKK